jgi:hypothetical protein
MKALKDEEGKAEEPDDAISSIRRRPGFAALYAGRRLKRFKLLIDGRPLVAPTTLELLHG